jgi:hypothetical protein
MEDDMVEIKDEYRTDTYYAAMNVRDALEVVIDVLRGKNRTEDDRRAAEITMRAIYSQRGIEVGEDYETAAEIIDVWMFG